MCVCVCSGECVQLIKRGPNESKTREHNGMMHVVFSLHVFKSQKVVLLIYSAVRNDWIALSTARYY